jgi:hypothetical protein
LTPTTTKRNRRETALEVVDRHPVTAAGGDLAGRPDLLAGAERDHLRRHRVARGDPARRFEQRRPVAVEGVDADERQRARVGGELPGGCHEKLLLIDGRGGDAVEVPQGRDAPLADHALGLLGDDAQHAGDRPAVVVDGAVGERVVALLLITGALDEQQQRLIEGRLAGAQHLLDPGADVGPDLGPDLAGGTAQRPRILVAERLAPVGVVTEERQLRTPRHPHGKARRQHHAHHRAQAARPGVGRTKRCLRPVDRE